LITSWILYWRRWRGARSGNLFHGVVAADRFDDVLLFPLDKLVVAVAILVVARLLGPSTIGAGDFAGFFVPCMGGRVAGIERQFVVL